MPLRLTFTTICPLHSRAGPQKRTFLHIITQSCLTISRLEDGTYGPTVEDCNNSPLQAWTLRNLSQLEVARRLYFSPTDYIL